jgi:hypothetical protein
VFIAPPDIEALSWLQDIAERQPRAAVILA